MAKIYLWNSMMGKVYSSSDNFLENNDRGISLIGSANNIFDNEFLKLYHGPYKGTPFRTYVGKKYKGGYSDHFPVYLILKKV